MAMILDTTTASDGKNIVLTEREVEVLGLVLEGRSSKEVAQALFVSKRTVDFHLAKIYHKLQANNRVQAIRRATALGLVTSTTQQPMA